MLAPEQNTRSFRLVTTTDFTDQELAEAARPLLDQLHAAELDGLRQLFETRKGQGRTTTDIAEAASSAAGSGA